MAKAKATKKESTTASPVVDSLQEESSFSSAEQRAWQYVGPDYFRGIQVPGQDRLLTPREWSDADITSNMETIPECRQWFLPSDKL